MLIGTLVLSTLVAGGAVSAVVLLTPIGWPAGLLLLPVLASAAALLIAAAGGEPDRGRGAAAPRNLAMR